jgi:hypothetical protein
MYPNKEYEQRDVVSLQHSVVGSSDTRAPLPRI